MMILFLIILNESQKMGVIQIVAFQLQNGLNLFIEQAK